VNTVRTSLLLPLALILLNVPPTMSAQGSGTPDLSGTWKMNASKSKLPKASKTGSQILVIKQDGLQIEFHFDIDGKQSVNSYTADKQEKVLREVPQAGSKIVAKAYWKGATLITETKAVFSMSSPLGSSEMMNTKDSWTVSADGLVLTEKSQWEDGESLTLYEKR
jgi:hypothetical protein